MKTTRIILTSVFLLFGFFLVNKSAKAQLDFTWTGNCVNNTTFFTPTGISIPAVQSWYWDFGDGSTSTLPNPGHVYLNGGSYLASLTATDTFGINATVSHYVIINPAPNANFVSIPASCMESYVQFTNLSSTSNGYITQWTWDFDNGHSVVINFPSNPNSQSFYYFAGSYDVKLTVMTNEGCIDSVSHPLEINPKPIADFSSENFAVNTPVLFTDNSLPGGTGSLSSWLWDFGDPASGILNQSFLQNPEHIYTQPGIYNVSEIVTNSFNCSDTIFHSVAIQTSTNLTFTYSGECAGSAIQFQAQTSGINAVEYIWSFGDNSFGSGPSPTHVYNASGSYLAELTVTDNLGATYVAFNTVVIVPKPSADFIYLFTECIPGPVPFTDQSYGGTGPVIQWNWNFDDPASGSSNISTLQNPVHNFISPGNHAVKLIVFDGNGCSDTIVKFINIIETPVADFSFPSPGCYYNSIQFTDLSQQNGNSPIISWQWEFGDGSTSNIQNPSHTYDFSNIFHVELTVENSAGCSNTITKPVTILPPPIVNFSFTNPIQNQPVQFTDLSFFVNGSINDWVWNFGDGGISYTQNPIHTYNIAGTYTVNLQVTASSACSSYGDTVLIVQPGGSGLMLEGKVYANGTAITEANVSLIVMDNNGFPIQVLQTIPDQDYYFRFNDLPSGDYYLKASPIYPGTYYQDYLPTYYSSSVFWEDAEMISLGIPLNPYEISLIPYYTSINGGLTITGQLIIGEKNISSSNQVIILFDSQNNPVQWTTTDSNGNFTFDNLIAGTYSVYPEITGFTTIPATITLNEMNSPLSVIMTVSGGFITNKPEYLKNDECQRVFPNPANEVLFLNLPEDESAYLISISDLSGKQCKQLSFKGGKQSININDLSAGVYFILIESASYLNSFRIVIQ